MLPLPRYLLEQGGLHTSYSSSLAHSELLARSVTAVLVVSTLIFVLGIDLVKEALWDTCHRMSKPEYITIADTYDRLGFCCWRPFGDHRSSLDVSIKTKVSWGLLYTHANFNINQALSFSRKTPSDAAFVLCTQGKLTLSTVCWPGAHRAYLCGVS